MSSLDHISTLVDTIVSNDEIDPIKLKNLFQLIVSQIDDNMLGKAEVNLKPFTFSDIKNQAYKLAELIEECEEYLDKLIDVPKTKVVIRNEGHKLDSIIESIENLRIENAKLKSELDYNTKTIDNLMVMKCKQPKKFYDVANCFEIETLNADVCDLKEKLFKFENELEENAVKMNAMEKDIKDIHKQIEHVHVIPDLVEKVQKLIDWKIQLREDIDIMTERYEHVKTIKVSKCELCGLLENKVNYDHLSRYVLNDKFNLARNDFRLEFEALRQLFCELQFHLTEKLVDLHKDVQVLFVKLASKNRLEKRSLK